MQPLSGLENPGIIDGIGEDTTTGTAVLIISENRPWTGDDRQLFQLQEKLNAYVSFALDGEMTEAYPSLVGKPLRIEIRGVNIPDARTAGFMQAVHDQLALQEIGFEVRVLRRADRCGESCACSNS